jgi:transcriptional regulator with XRE-family HTH domain
MYYPPCVGTVAWPIIPHMPPAPTATVDLRVLRTALDLTQVEAAARIGITQAHYSMLERRGNHRTATIRRVVEGLGCALHVTATTPAGDLVVLGPGTGKTHRIMVEFKTAPPKETRRTPGSRETRSARRAAARD